MNNVVNGDLSQIFHTVFSAINFNFIGQRLILQKKENDSIKKNQYQKRFVQRSKSFESVNSLTISKVFY